MEIEVGTTEDADAVADLWVDLAADQRAYGSHVLPEPNRRVVRETVARHAVTDTLLVARDPDGRVVGFLTAEREVGDYETDADRAVVTNVYVAPAHRNRGVGSDLLATAEDRLRERGVDAVALEAMADNGAARRFYREAGYRPHRVELEKPLENGTHSKED